MDHYFTSGTIRTKSDAEHTPTIRNHTHTPNQWQF